MGTFSKGYNRFLRRLKEYDYDVDSSKLTYSWYCVFRKRSQPQKMWWHLQNYKKITSGDAEDIYGFRHPPSVIRDIRKKLIQEGSDYQIDNITKNGFDRWDNPCKYDEYTLRTV